MMSAVLRTTLVDQYAWADWLNPRAGMRRLKTANATPTCPKLTAAKTNGEIVGPVI